MTRAVPAAMLVLAGLACGAPHGQQRPQTAPSATPGPAATGRPTRCDPGNGGLTLPAGFCATVFADSLGPVRHITVAPNGVLYGAVATRRGVGGGVVALRDQDGDGRAEFRQHFGEGSASGIALHGSWLYFALNDRVVRWRLSPGEVVPAGAPEEIVTGLPTGGHTAKTIALDGRGGLYVNVGSRTNSCQVADRQLRSPGEDPCAELATRAGVWRFSADRAGQTQPQGTRLVTGARNTLALAFAPDGALYGAIHGRDQLSAHWPEIYDDRRNAENPAEEFVRLEEDADYGWPYCYYDVDHRRKVLAPEYGGNGSNVGRCAGAREPLIAFPAHWAPMALAFYTGALFPARYRGGAFLSFHGSWNRAPLPQAGFRVVFVPFQDGRAGAWETFAEGFLPAESGASRRRPMGLAVGPDGALYVGDDAGGRIWRIVPGGN